MGSLFRSEAMVLLRLYFERAAGHATVDELGRMGLVEFRDLNAGTSAFQRAFAANVRMCEEMQRRLRYLRGCIREGAGIEVEMGIEEDLYAMKAEGLRLEELGGRLQDLEVRLSEMRGNWELLRKQLNQLVEWKCVLEKGGFFLKTGPRAHEAEYGTLRLPQPLGGGDEGMFGVKDRGPRSSSVMEEGLVRGDVGSEVRAGSGTDTEPSTGLPSSSTLLSFYAGVIAKERAPTFERVLFRATRGNCHARFADIESPLIDPHTGESVMKTVFMIFFSGSLVKTKVAKICLAFEANLYDFPEDPAEQKRTLKDVTAQVDDLRSVIDTTASHRRDILTDIAPLLPVWDEKIRREKGIFHSLNLLNFDTSNSLFIAEIWCPSYAVDDVRCALDIGRKRSHAQVPSVIEERPHGRETAPTYYKINKLTQVFHSIVESYGVAQYQEVNPAPFTIITFPFLFAVMFGDVGHGVLMTVFAALIVMNERRMVRRTLNEFMQTCYDGRYLLLLMGLFSIFTGLIYNECFAVPLNLFSSRWKFTNESAMACGIDNCVDPAAVRAPLRPYPFGFDPVWKGSGNGLLFFNSYKMKLSIVLGVSQMVLGICLSYKNARFFKEPLDVWYVFVPQMIFMNATFGYLVFLILFKWVINWDSSSCLADPNCVPPDLKTVLIGMFMSPGSVPAQGRLYRGQAFIQTLLLLAAVTAVPWMLLAKPLLLRARNRRTSVETYRPLVEDAESQKLLSKSNSNGADPVRGDGNFGGSGALEDSDCDEGVHGTEKFDFTEVMVNQMIHTIEFVLGAVSNTASYLRLWALSLAHAELSDVFLEKLLYLTFWIGSPVVMVVGFFMWVGVTVGVLMFMESLSAFLHALRLHWVEFQNKFYNLHGSGKKFVPFDYRILQEDALAV